MYPDVLDRSGACVSAWYLVDDDGLVDAFVFNADNLACGWLCGHIGMVRNKIQLDEIRTVVGSLFVLYGAGRGLSILLCSPVIQYKGACGTRWLVYWDLYDADDDCANS